MLNLNVPFFTNEFSTTLKSIHLVVVIFLLNICTIQAQHGLKVEYYNGIYFDSLVSQNYVGNIDQSWNFVAPVSGLDPHSCSIRWTGKLIPATSRDYVLSARVDDGIRVWLNNDLIIDQWDLHDQGEFQGNVFLEAGNVYNLKVEYFNALKEGEIQLLWNIPSQDQSWYEYFFEESTIPIPKDYFFRPDEIEHEPIKPKIEEKVNREEKKKPKPIKKKEKESTIIEPIKVENKVASKKITTSKEAEKFIPKNIAFERGKNSILESSINELKIFGEFMLDNPQVQVSIEGHTDPVGDAALNLKLSKERALKVANFLVEAGVDKKRIKSEGYGGTQPLVVPKKGEYHPANRRVVFVLSGIN